MRVKKPYSTEDAERGAAFLNFCTKPGNEGYLRAFYYWLRNELKKRKLINKNLTHYHVGDMMIEYVLKGLNTKTTDDKTLIPDDELRFFQSKP